MASLGNESFDGYEQQVLDDDDRYSRLAKKIWHSPNSVDIQ
jgi:hypothetical protein